MNKKAFDQPEFEIIFMDNEDIIVTSTCLTDEACPNDATCSSDRTCSAYFCFFVGK